jgi:hypothetical protein
VSGTPKSEPHNSACRSLMEWTLLNSAQDTIATVETLTDR